MVPTCYFVSGTSVRLCFFVLWQIYMSSKSFGQVNIKGIIHSFLDKRYTRLFFEFFPTYQRTSTCTVGALTICMEFSGGSFGTNGSLFLPVKTGQNMMLYHLSKMTQLSLVDWGDLSARFTKSSTVGERMARMRFLQMVQLIPVILVETKKRGIPSKAFLLFQKIFTRLDCSI